MAQVQKAESYRMGALGPNGDAKFMLLRQVNFPDQFNEDEDLRAGAHLDKLLEQFPDRVKACILHNTGTERIESIEYWAIEASDEDVLAFVRTMLVDTIMHWTLAEGFTWTGCRITAGIFENRHRFFYFEIFAKGLTSDTTVYSGQSAPNVMRHPESSSKLFA